MIVRSARPERYTVLDNDILRNHAREKAQQEKDPDNAQ